MKASKELQAFIEGGAPLPSHPDERELARLLLEVAETEVPDPGSDYWLSFNQRLNQKIAALPPKKTSWFHRHTGWRYLLAVCTAMALVLIALPLVQKSKPTPDIAALSPSSLSVIAGLTTSSDLFYEELPESLDFQVEDSELNLLDEASLFDEY